MKSYSSTDLKQNLGDVLAAAAQEPVAITRHAKPRYVLMSFETYEARMARDPRRAVAVEDMPDEHLDLIESALSEAADQSRD